MQGEDDAAPDRSQRRSYGTGSLYVRTDRNGRDTWYGYWRTNGREVRRRIGLRRTAASQEGLTRAQAEAELRRLIGCSGPLGGEVHRGSSMTTPAQQR